MNEITKDCLECGRCSNTCFLLSEIGQSPATILNRGIEVREAFSCSLCGACETACPRGLSPKEMFAGRRDEAVKNSEFNINDYRYMFPDREKNIMSAYRKHHGIDYRDIEHNDIGGTWFFPGCTLMTYAPGLTRETFLRLKDSCGCEAMWSGCCGKPLEQMGLQHRFVNMREQLKSFLCKYNITSLITACPGCYYELRNVFKDCDVSIQTVYEVLDFKLSAQAAKQRCAVHDSCPDRFTGSFGSQVRQALEKRGLAIVEMEHNKENTICCGSGGQISHFRPELAEKLVRQRFNEVERSGADILVAYCLSCALKFDVFHSPVPVAHALNLLLGKDVEFNGAKERVGQMFSGSNGEKIWEEIMAD